MKNDDAARSAINTILLIPTGSLRLFTIWLGLKSEIKIPGMRMTAKAPKCSTILRKEFGLSGKPDKLLAQFQALLLLCGVLDPNRHDLTPPVPRQATVSPTA